MRPMRASSRSHTWPSRHRLAAAGASTSATFRRRTRTWTWPRRGQVPRWRESEVFTPLERDVLEYAEAMTNTPPTVTDELSARLLDRLGPAAMIELTVFIAFSNFATRSNNALGIESQGFSAACEIPLAARPEHSLVASTA